MSFAERRSPSTAADRRIVTTRLTLRPWEAGDLDALHGLWTDAGVRRFLWDGEVITREKAEEVVRAGIDSFERHGFGFWGVRERDRAHLVGFCGLRFVEPTSDVEILYGIAPLLWARGYATEAARALLAWAFRETGLTRIFAGADAPNRASLRVIEKLGMRQHGIRPTAAGETLYYVIEGVEFRDLSAARDNSG